MLREVGRPRKRRPIGRPRVKALVSGTEQDKRVVHLATCPKAILPHRNRVERRLYAVIFNIEPHLTNTDALLVQQLARDLAVQDFYWHYFQQNPEKWIESAAHKAFYTGQKNITRIASELALSTSTKIKLGIDVARFKQQSAIDAYQKADWEEEETPVVGVIGAPVGVEEDSDG